MWVQYLSPCQQTLLELPGICKRQHEVNTSTTRCPPASGAKRHYEAPAPPENLQLQVVTRLPRTFFSIPKIHLKKQFTSMIHSFEQNQDLPVTSHFLCRPAPPPQIEKNMARHFSSYYKAVLRKNNGNFKENARHLWLPSLAVPKASTNPPRTSKSETKLWTWVCRLTWNCDSSIYTFTHKSS